MSAKAVLFDMDGVIFDSERAVLACWQEVGARFSLCGIEQVFVRCVGVNKQRTRQIFSEAYPELDFDRFDEAVRTLFLSRYDKGRLPLKPGVREILSALKEAGIPLALASSTRLVTVRRELDEAGLLPFFDAVIGGDTVAHSKPDPEIFLTAASLLDAAPADCWVIEDSFNGVRAAHAGGMHPIMVPDLLPPDAEMEEKAEIMVKDLFEAMAYLLPIV